MTSFYFNSNYNSYVMIIYVDVLFLQNLILDCIILLATKIICNQNTKWWKLLLGGSVGSFSSIFAVVFHLNNFFLKILLSIFIILVTFGYQNKKRFFKIIGVFYITTIMFGGMSFMLMFLLSPEKIVYYAGKFLGYYPVKMTILRRRIWIFFNYICSKNTK